MVSVDKLAVNLVASFTSELVIPFALLFTMCSMDEYQRSDPGSLKESILSSLNMWFILCLNCTALWNSFVVRVESAVMYLNVSMLFAISIETLLLSELFWMAIS